MSTTLDNAPAINLTLGAVLIGGLVSVFFSGIVSMQVFLYYRIYKDDRRRFKYMVSAVWLLDIIHTCMVCTLNWTFLVDNFGNIHVFDFIPWAFAVTIILTVLITFLIHCFFAHRILTLSKYNWFVSGPIFLLAALRLGAALSTTGEMMRLRSFDLFFAQYRWLFILGLSLSAAVDTMIAAALCWFLHQSRTGFSKMDGIIDTITAWTIQNGLVTCIATLASLICWITMQHALVWLALYLTISKLYANAFMATLNARKTLRGRSHSSYEMNSENPMPILFNEPFSGHYSRNAYMSRQQDQISTKVQINVEKTIQHDDDDDRVPSPYSGSTPTSTQPGLPSFIEVHV